MAAKEVPLNIAIQKKANIACSYTTGEFFSEFPFQGK
jgi:hypothetical protein